MRKIQQKVEDETAEHVFEINKCCTCHQISINI